MERKSLSEIIESERPASRGERVLKWVYLFAPIVSTLGILLLVGLAWGPGRAGDLLAWAVSSFTILGKLIILKGITSASMDPFEFALLVFYLDLAVASFLTFNLDYAYRVPYLGRRLEGLQEHGRRVLEEKPWLGRLTWLGVVLFVLFPLTGTGAVGGSIFGRLVGLGRYRILSGILTGSAVGCFGIAALARGLAGVLPEETRTSGWFEGIGIGVVVLVVVLLWLRSRQIERGRVARRAGSREGPVGAREGGS